MASKLVAKEPNQQTLFNYKDINKELLRLQRKSQQSYKVTKFWLFPKAYVRKNKRS